MREKAEAIYGHYYPASRPGAALLDAWVLYLDENKPADWPAELVQKHIAESEKAVARFARVPDDIQYPLPARRLRQPGLRLLPALQCP